MTAAELLKQAKETLQLADLDYRGSLLKCGKLLHEFVLDYLRQGDNLNEFHRLKKKITRRYAIQMAADELGCNAQRIGNLITAAMVVELFGCDEGNCLGWSSLYIFGCFIGRKRGNRFDTAGRSGCHLISSEEEWSIKEEFADKSKALYRKIIDEGMSQVQVRKEVADLFQGRSPFSRAKIPQRRKHPSKPQLAPVADDDEDDQLESIGKPADTSMEALVRQVAVASPGDVAEMCLAMIEASQEPYEVAIRLRVLMERFLTKKKRVVG